MSHPRTSGTASAAPKLLLVLGVGLPLLPLLFCGCSDAEGGRDGGAGRGRGGWSGARGGARTMRTTTAVPVRVEPVTRRTISEYLESNGVLEAEKDVDIVARVAGPVVELKVEEGMEVKKDDLLARIDDREYRNRVAAATVSRDQAQLTFERAQRGWDSRVISSEEYDTARIGLEAAKTELKSAEILLAYSEIRAPFGGLIARRYVREAQYVATDTPLFRISDFTPLWCPIQVPEKDISRLRVGQRAHLDVDSFPGRRFPAHVLRISPVVDAATGTLKVTLEADGQGKLRPGMFASVFLETDVHQGALVIPKAALVLDSIGDAVFIAVDGAARRREVRLGFRDSAAVEVLEGLEEGDEVIVLGQDGLNNGTPITVLAEDSGDAPGSTPDRRVEGTRPGPTVPPDGATADPQPHPGPRERQGDRDGARRGGRSAQDPERADAETDGRSGRVPAAPE